MKKKLEDIWNWLKRKPARMISMLLGIGVALAAVMRWVARRRERVMIDHHPVVGGEMTPDEGAEAIAEIREDANNQREDVLNESKTEHERIDDWLDGK